MSFSSTILLKRSNRLIDQKCHPTSPEKGSVDQIQQQKPEFPTLYHILTAQPQVIHNSRAPLGPGSSSKGQLRSVDEYIGQCTTAPEPNPIKTVRTVSSTSSGLKVDRSAPQIYESTPNRSAEHFNPLHIDEVLNYVLSNDCLNHLHPVSGAQSNFQFSPSICDRNSSNSEECAANSCVHVEGCASWVPKIDFTQKVSHTLHVREDPEPTVIMRRKRKPTLNVRVDVDIDDSVGISNTTCCDENISAQKPSSPDAIAMDPKDESQPTQNNLIDTILDQVVNSAEAGLFDLSDLQDAFLNFFEKGEVSNDLDAYFTKVLESEGIETDTDAVDPSSLPGSRHKRRLVDEGIPWSIDSNVAKKLAERRFRNNEASRRSRLAHKARFQALAQEITEMKFEKRELVIWLNEVQLAVKEARRILLSPGSPVANSHSRSTSRAAKSIAR